MATGLVELHFSPHKDNSFYSLLLAESHKDHIKVTVYDKMRAMLSL